MAYICYKLIMHLRHSERKGKIVGVGASVMETATQIGQ
jgi:hypothetical protein